MCRGVSRGSCGVALNNEYMAIGPVRSAVTLLSTMSVGVLPKPTGIALTAYLKNSAVAIGTVGGSPRKLKDRDRFEEGLKELVKRLHPHTIILYGSDNYPCFKELEKQGIKILAYPSKTSKVFAGRAK